MLLHEFMSDHRDEILNACHEQLWDLDEPALGYLEEFFDEIVRAIGRDLGVRESVSPLPGKSETAARFGADRERAGLPVTQVPRFFAAISQALAVTGERYELTISAEEYKLLNLCLDAGLATSIENFWDRQRDRDHEKLTQQFGFLAHELRNALGNTNLAFKLLRTGSVAISGRTADVLGRNLLRMEALIAQCLASVQLDVGVSPELRPVAVATVLRDLETSFIPDRGISIQLDADESLLINADENLLTSAVSNLLHNAVKFSRPDSVIRLSTHAFGGLVRIEVQDHCGGLNHENPEELFQPFVKRREGNRTGSGLGLAITKRAVEAMGGHMTVIDHPGDGCVFTAHFPAHFA